MSTKYISRESEWSLLFLTMLTAQQEAGPTCQNLLYAGTLCFSFTLEKMFRYSSLEVFFNFSTFQEILKASFSF